MDFENPVRIPTSFSYRDFKNAFAAVENIANHQKEKLIFVMDEFPYFAESAQRLVHFCSTQLIIFIKNMIMSC